MSRRKAVFAALAALALAGWLWLFWPWAHTLFEFHCRLRAGMTLAEVEAVLGEGERELAPPGVGDGGSIRPAVQGDTFYRWERGGNEIWLGLRGGRVVDKWL